MEMSETIYRIEIRLAKPNDKATTLLKSLGCQWDNHGRCWWLNRMSPNAEHVRALVALIQSMGGGG